MVQSSLTEIRMLKNLRVVQMSVLMRDPNVLMVKKIKSCGNMECGACCDGTEDEHCCNGEEDHEECRDKAMNTGRIQVQAIFPHEHILDPSY